VSAPVFPELVHGRRDGFEQGAWSIENGSVHRGDASCNLSERRLRVPDGRDDVARVVRAHELMHIRVSPHSRVLVPSEVDVSERALECAEEFRVNHLLSLLRFDTGLLHDGSERLGARRVGEANRWDEAVCFYVAVLGTGAETDYLKGVRATQPSWPPILRALRKAVLGVVTDQGAAEVGDTALSDEGYSTGFERVTIPVARLITRTIGTAPPTDAEGLRRFRRSLEPGARRAPSEVFAALAWDETMDYVARARRRGHRRVRPSTSGTVMRYPDRLLTDPMCRAFAQKTSVVGGVIVIDQSGSMDVTLAELDALLVGAPGALIIGYSHRPGDQGRTANAWVLANGGRVASRARSGNIGNGVDGPVLRWAVRRAAGQPVVWVTDGQVTDSNDHPCHSLSVECAQLVRRHRIVLVRSLADVESALRGRRSPVDGFGRVGREVVALSRR
jgi:hypothetical protein